MRVFAHHLYEFNKGLRRLILHTTKAEYRDEIITRLERRGIPYIIQNVTDSKINVFFGDRFCIEVLKSFPDLNLRDLDPDKDFILGAMLGYDMRMHCRRYLNRIRESEEKNRNNEKIAV